MTERETLLLEVAKEIIKLNTNSQFNLRLTGSLMLELQGFTKRREAQDIDFLVDEHELIAEENSPYCPVVPEGYIMDYFGEKSSPKSIQFFNPELNIKIDFLPSYEGKDFCKDIPCSDIGYLISAKEHIIRETSDSATREKHQLDINYLYENNDL